MGKFDLDTYYGYSKLTNFAEILEKRWKTLDFDMFLALLAVATWMLNDELDIFCVK